MLQTEQKVLTVDNNDETINKAITDNKGWIVHQLTISGDKVIILFTRTTVS